MEIITLAKQATGAFRRFVEENPRLAGVLMKTAAGLSVLLIVMGSIAVAVAAIIGPMAVMRLGFAMVGVKLPSIIGMLGGLAKGVRFVGSAMLWLGRAMLTNPILAVLAAIAIAAIYIWQNWDTLGPKIKALWASITQWTQQTWDAITRFISTKWDEIVAGRRHYPRSLSKQGEA
ncbi:hypothetical protein PCI56_09085 [Plesiomonas shigelloides subsp. oncorhynchi]|nr:hypothetical protein [Plesiomonas shigelloides]